MKEQLKPKLKPLPCPFCGKTPRLMPSHPEFDGNAWGEIRCVNRRCAAQPHVEDGSKLADSRGSGAYIDLAIRRWNRRANSAPVADEGGTHG